MQQPLTFIEKKKKNASRVLEEFANVRTILPKISSFLRLRIHSNAARRMKQLYFFSGFNTGPVYHLRVVERFAQQNLCFVFNLSELIKLKLNLLS